MGEPAGRSRLFTEDGRGRRDNPAQRCRRACDGRRRHLVELEALAARLHADAVRLRLPADRPPGARLRRLESSIAELAGRIAAAREALEAAEQELVRHDRAAAHRAARARPPAARGRLPPTIPWIDE